MDSYQKCDRLLKNYNDYKLSDGKLARKCVKRIDNALNALKSEKYIGIITMYYIGGLTMETIAEVYDISTVTAYAQKKKLIHKLKTILCSDEAIKELLGK